MSPSSDTFASAMATVSSGTSLRTACKQYGIKSHATLGRRIKAKTAYATQMGPKSRYLTPGMKAGIVQLVELRSRFGMCITNTELRFIIRQAAASGTKRYAYDGRRDGCAAAPR